MESKEDFIVVDIDACIGCGNCLAVCHLNEKIDNAIMYGKKIKNTLFKVVNGLINRNNVCWNCTDAPCLDACDKGILKKDGNGVVYLDLDIDEDEPDIEKIKICNKCHQKCIEACPSGELFLSKIKCGDTMYSIPIKCDLCEGDPECVKACPTGAIRFINISSEKHKDKRKHAEILAKVSELVS
ncbi:MAG: hypothetical protein GF329_11665 [Candidatus Lokiarchaeota archaeon]|nr:hypothetical protein [Candidatus Lokiarchaeota archaeon]